MSLTLAPASWQTASSTGAVSHMDYGEVQSYAGLYAVQELFVDRQKGSIQRVADASTIFSGNRDPHQAPIEDLHLFRRHVMAMYADLVLEEQLERRLIETYDAVLAAR